MSAYDDKQEARKERLIALADKMQAASDAAYNQARRMADVIPLGQPILIGHHSEGRDRRYRARIWRTHERCAELKAKADYFRQKAASVGTGGISSDDSEAVTKLREKLVNLERLQDRMKAANAAIRKHSKAGPGAQVAALVAQGFNEGRARNLLEPDFCGRIGFADFETKNNNANMRRTRDRIAELERKPTETTEQAVGEVRIVANAEANRVQMFFHGKPADGIRAELKAHGFHWSPTEGAWQRHLSDSAKYYAEAIARRIK
jgi:hypothetical protein